MRWRKKRSDLVRISLFLAVFNDKITLRYTLSVSFVHVYFNIVAVYKTIEQLNILFKKCMLFSSPEPKAQGSFSDQNLSVARRRPCCRKLFTFSSFFQEPLGQFQPNLAQSILW